MPELPEVETMRRGILACAGSTIARAVLEICPCKPILVAPAAADLQQRIARRKITAVDRLGKRVVLRLDSTDALVFEPRMTGLVLIADPPDREHLRFRLDLSDGPIASIWYWDRRGLGSVRLFTADEMESLLGRNQLGIDALAITALELRQVLGKSSRAVKVALLDQKAIAGVGNLYASEILHRAKVHPERSCDSLSSLQWTRIHTQLQAVLREAIEHEGSTLSDGTYRNALNRAGGYQNCHVVYDREGELCRSCETASVVRMVQAQRSTFFCPRCQRAKRTKSRD